MGIPIMGRQLNAPFKRLCDFDGPGHNRIIMPNKPMYQVRVGEAQGNYHNIRCYQAALSRYKSLKQKLGLQQKAQDE